MRSIACAAALLAALTGCGGADDGGRDRDEVTSAATVARDDLVACLTEAGLEATDPAVEYPEELQERDAIVETVAIAGAGGLTGLGSATWYESHEAAVAGDEAAGLVSTDEVRRGVAGRVAWRWAGEAAAADLIEECLAG